MIPEYRLIHSLIKLPSNKEISKEIKKIIKTINYRSKRKLYSFIFNINNNKVFNNIFSLDARLNKFELEAYYIDIINFNLIIAGLMPIFEFQKLSYKDYKKIQKCLKEQALQNDNIKKWFQESSINKENNNLSLNFILKNKKIPKDIKEKIKNLTHISGKIFESLKNMNYELGYYFMLFYLLTLETRKTLQLKSTTNWNLKSYFEYEDFFKYKLLIIQKFNKILMNTEIKKFNLYWRIINYGINNLYD